MYQRHSSTSQQAYEYLSGEQKQLDEVYNYILQAGNQGLTGREVAKIMDKPIGTISARMTTLIRQKRIKRSNITRKVDGRMSTVCFADSTTMGQVAPDSSQKRDRLKGVMKELLLNKSNDGSLVLSAIDVKRIERMLK